MSLGPRHAELAIVAASVRARADQGLLCLGQTSGIGPRAGHQTRQGRVAAKVEIPCKTTGRRSIGAPGFEPGTSPTRTVRATRLRHAPRRKPVFHTPPPPNPGIFASVAAVALAEIINELDALL